MTSVMVWFGLVGGLPKKNGSPGPEICYEISGHWALLASKNMIQLTGPKKSEFFVDVSGFAGLNLMTFGIKPMGFPKIIRLKEGI